MITAGGCTPFYFDLFLSQLKAEFTKQYDDMVKELQQEAESRDQVQFNVKI